ncbi:hypothetical protein JYU34_007536, partial [Plutella xylostella]
MNTSRKTDNAATFPALPKYYAKLNTARRPTRNPVQSQPDTVVRKYLTAPLGDQEPR